LWYWDQDPLELIAAALFSKPHRHKKKSLSRILEGKTFRTFVIYLAIKNKYVFIKYAVVIYVAMCCQSLISDAWVHAYINVQHAYLYTNQVGELGKSRGW
jgi:hypothetical protein